MATIVQAYLFTLSAHFSWVKSINFMPSHPKTLTNDYLEQLLQTVREQRLKLEEIRDSELTQTELSDAMVKLKCVTMITALLEVEVCILELQTGHERKSIYAT
jgi:hypothetical protein